jgi:hypothetical protein
MKAPSWLALAFYRTSRGVTLNIEIKPKNHETDDDYRQKFTGLVRGRSTHIQ